MAQTRRTAAERGAERTTRTATSTRRLPAAKQPPAAKRPVTKRTASAAKRPVTKKTPPAAKAPVAPKSAQKTAAQTSPQGTAAPAGDSLVVALEVWRSVVAALRQAKYDEVGPAYGKLSTLLVQQRTGDLLAGAPDRAEWAELSATAQEAVELLEPVLTAARQLVTLPSRVDLDPKPLAASTDAAHTGRPARRRAATK